MALTPEQEELLAFADQQFKNWTGKDYRGTTAMEGEDFTYVRGSGSGGEQQREDLDTYLNIVLNHARENGIPLYTKNEDGNRQYLDLGVNYTDGSYEIKTQGGKVGVTESGGPSFTAPAVKDDKTLFEGFKDSGGLGIMLSVISAGTAGAALGAGVGAAAGSDAALTFAEVLARGNQLANTAGDLYDISQEGVGSDEGGELGEEEAVLQEIMGPGGVWDIAINDRTGGATYPVYEGIYSKDPTDVTTGPGSVVDEQTGGGVMADQPTMEDVGGRDQTGGTGGDDEVAREEQEPPPWWLPSSILGKVGDIFKGGTQTGDGTTFPVPPDGGTPPINGGGNGGLPPGGVTGNGPPTAPPPTDRPGGWNPTGILGDVLKGQIPTGGDDDMSEGSWLDTILGGIDGESISNAIGDISNDLSIVFDSRAQAEALEKAIEASKFDPYNVYNPGFGKSTFNTETGEAEFVADPQFQNIQDMARANLENEYMFNPQPWMARGAAQDMGLQFLPEVGQDALTPESFMPGTKMTNAMFSKLMNAGTGMMGPQGLLGKDFEGDVNYERYGQRLLAGDQTQKAQELFDKDYSQLVDERLGNLRESAAPYEERQFNSLQNKLFSQGRLGSTGGARMMGELFREQNQADMARQETAYGMADTLRGQNFQTGTNLYGSAGTAMQGAGNLGLGAQQNVLGQYGTAGNLLGTTGKLAADNFNAYLTGTQAENDRGSQRLENLTKLFGFGGDAVSDAVDTQNKMVDQQTAFLNMQNAPLEMGGNFGGRAASAGGVQGNFMTQLGQNDPNSTLLKGLSNIFGG